MSEPKPQLTKLNPPKNDNNATSIVRNAMSGVIPNSMIDLYRSSTILAMLFGSFPDDSSMGQLSEIYFNLAFQYQRLFNIMGFDAGPLNNSLTILYENELTRLVSEERDRLKKVDEKQKADAKPISEQKEIPIVPTPIQKDDKK